MEKRRKTGKRRKRMLESGGKAEKSIKSIKRRKRRKRMLESGVKAEK